MGFDPYKRIKRRRTTRAGDIAFVAVFLLMLVGLVAWAVWG